MLAHDTSSQFQNPPRSYFWFYCQLQDDLHSSQSLPTFFLLNVACTLLTISFTKSSLHSCITTTLFRPLPSYFQKDFTIKLKISAPNPNKFIFTEGQLLELLILATMTRARSPLSEWSLFWPNCGKRSKSDRFGNWCVPQQEIPLITITRGIPTLPIGQSFQTFWEYDYPVPAVAVQLFDRGADGPLGTPPPFWTMSDRPQNGLDLLYPFYRIPLKR